MPGPAAVAPDPPSRTAAPAALTLPALGSLLDALSDVDRVELQVSLLDDDRRPAAAALGLDSLEAEVSEVAFLDTAQLSLLRAGIVLRTRRTQDQPASLQVTLLWCDPPSLSADLRRLPGFRVDLDARPTGFACSCSLETPVSDRTVAAVLAGDLPPYQVLTAHQRRLVSVHTPVDVATHRLAVLGPIHVLSHRLSPPGFRRGLVAEQWFLPGGTRRLHLAVPCRPAKVLKTLARVQAFLDQPRVRPTPANETTTRSALAALSGGIQPPGPRQPEIARRQGTATGRSSS
jgi:hypothetical protein